MHTSARHNGNGLDPELLGRLERHFVQRIKTLHGSVYARGVIADRYERPDRIRNLLDDECVALIVQERALPPHTAEGWEDAATVALRPV